jgi:predicted transcriptional regulator
MGITDTIDNKMKRSKSMKQEKKDINEKMDDIADATVAASEELLEIGRYFWKKYIAGTYEPEPGIKVRFDNLDTLNERVSNLVQEIDDRKISGTKEREVIDDNTRRSIREKQDRKAEKAEEKARRQAEKENEE